MSETKLDIIYHDDDLVAINKPSGLLVHRSRIAAGAREFAMQKLRDQLGQHVYPVHRLDRPTSGVLLFALSSEVARLLMEQFQQRQIDKVYHAVVRGYTQQQGIINHALKEQLDKIADAKAQQDKAPQEAVTYYRTLAQVELPFQVSKRHQTNRYSLVELLPQHGRKHQLRRHMAHISHPIVGDSNHGDGRHNRFFKQQFDCPRLLLHASELALQHPLSGEQLRLHAPLPPEFKRAFLFRRAQ